MTEADLWGIFLGFVELSSTVERDIISVIFAFLIAAYLVGAKLTRLQLAIVVCVYSVYLLNNLYALQNVYGRAIELAQQIVHLNPDQQLGLSSEAVNLTIGVFFIFYLSSLVFLVQVRRNAKKETKPSLKAS